MPSSAAETHQEVLRRLAAHQESGLVAHLRAVLVLDDGGWWPACGRIDVARREDAQKVASFPSRDVRLVGETVALPTLISRLEAALRGEPMLIEDDAIAQHGMEQLWIAERHTENWSDFEAAWPIVCLAPSSGVGRRLYVPGAIEAKGEVEAFDGLDDCVGAVMGLRDRSRGGQNIRFSRFQVIEWDYRGVMHLNIASGALHVVVEPGGNDDLSLAIVVRDNKGLSRRSFVGATEIEFPVDGMLSRVNCTLRHRDDVVCEVLVDALHEQAMIQYGGRPTRSLSELHSDPPPESTILELVLGFMADRTLAAMVARDITEIDVAVEGGAHKAAVLLIGSALEAMLLDVLARNEQHARHLLVKDWPDRASATQLLRALGTVSVILPDSSSEFLVPPLTAKKAQILSDHRDLIHPRAEVRGAAPIDAHTVRTMRGVLGEVLRDLRRAHEQGLLDAYGEGKVI
jgi:hypothetical protein